jgi:hypothetical protein
MDDLITRYKQGFGEKFMPTRVVEGALPAETRPWSTNVRNAAGEVVGEEPAITSSRVAAGGPGTDPADGFWRSMGENDPLVPKKAKYGKEGSIAAREEPPMRPQPSRSGPHQLVEEVTPAQRGPVMTDVELVGQPVGEHEAAKRALGEEGYLRGAKYFAANAAKHDPGIQAYRQAYGVLKGSVEDALPMSLLERFQPAKARSQIAQVFGPQGETAALNDFMPSASVRSSLHGQVKSGLIEAALNKTIPTRIRANEIMESIGKNLPEHTQDALRAAVIEVLRQKESPRGP